MLRFESIATHRETRMPEPTETASSNTQDTTGLPQQPASDTRYKGLGGWLILVGIGVVITPVIIAWEFLSVYLPLFRDGIFGQIASRASEFYNPWLAGLLVFEIAFNAVLFVLSLQLIRLYFGTHYRFPALYITLQLAFLISIPVFAILAAWTLPGIEVFDAETTSTLVRTLIPSAIWITYMLVSKRVRQTFVNGRPDAADPVSVA